MSRSFGFAAVLVFVAAPFAAGQSKEYKSGIIWPEPKVVDPGPPGGPPADAIVLFDGKNLDAWEGGENWKIEGRRGDGRRWQHHDQADVRRLPVAPRVRHAGGR